MLCHLAMVHNVFHHGTKLQCTAKQRTRGATAQDNTLGQCPRIFQGQRRPCRHQLSGQKATTKEILRNNAHPTPTAWRQQKTTTWPPTDRVGESRAEQTQVSVSPVAKHVHSMWITLESKNGRERKLYKSWSHVVLTSHPTSYKTGNGSGCPDGQCLRQRSKKGRQGVEKWGSRLSISHSAGAAQLRRQLRQFDCS